MRSPRLARSAVALVTGIVLGLVAGAHVATGERQGPTSPSNAAPPRLADDPSTGTPALEGLPPAAAERAGPRPAKPTPAWALAAAGAVAAAVGAGARRALLVPSGQRPRWLVRGVPRRRAPPSLQPA
jgi:hypothetical protein